MAKWTPEQVREAQKKEQAAKDVLAKEQAMHEGPRKLSLIVLHSDSAREKFDTREDPAKGSGYVGFHDNVANKLQGQTVAADSRLDRSGPGWNTTPVPPEFIEKVREVGEAFRVELPNSTATAYRITGNINKGRYPKIDSIEGPDNSLETLAEYGVKAENYYDLNNAVTREQRENVVKPAEKVLEDAEASKRAYIRSEPENNPLQSALSGLDAKEGNEKAQEGPEF